MSIVRRRRVQIGPSQFLTAMGIEPKLAYLLLTRFWQTGAGAVTLMFIALFFSPTTQGYYYTFYSLFALQSFIELGLYVVIVALASHAWASLSLDENGQLSGEQKAKESLAGLLRFTLRWYSILAIVFVFGVGYAGISFMSNVDQGSVDWQSPWLASVALAGAALWLLPVLSLLEGCNQILQLNRFRFRQALIEAFAAWVCIVSGAELWTITTVLAVRVSTTIGFLYLHYVHFITELLRLQPAKTFAWRERAWPMQWRLAVQGASSYLVHSAMTPIMFRFFGPTIAGQFGMSLQVTAVVLTTALAWLHVQVPALGALAAKRDFPAFEALWRRACGRSLVFAVAAAGSLLIVVWGITIYAPTFSERLLVPAAVAALLIGQIGLLISSFFSSYLRAFAKEPFLIVGTLSGVLTGVAVYSVGSRFGPTATAFAYASVIIAFNLPASYLVWRRLKIEWQK